MHVVLKQMTSFHELYGTKPQSVRHISHSSTCLLRTPGKVHTDDYVHTKPSNYDIMTYLSIVSIATTDSGEKT
jgi:hypothetical protein